MQDEAVRAARESVAITTNQYRAGTVSFLNVAIVQAAQLNNERTAVGLLGQRLAAGVALVKALGGGWDAAELPCGGAGCGRDRSRNGVIRDWCYDDA